MPTTFVRERIDQWPRVHTCLYNWCPYQGDECKRCDAVHEIMCKAQQIKEDRRKAE